MDKETLKYIITYYSNLMTTDEKIHLKHKIFIPENDYEEFEINIANRIIKESSQKIFFNNCPQCEKLARTPFAKQCKYCGHSWHSVSF
ncbi:MULTISPECIES: hypothetical protein [unclassified Chryseobacterium]|uniref:hypothetical protein n=1 Tax=unclassified Chryseobacterium TaxID=2593645 RepID=UPI002269BA87|nr:MULTISPECIES: hypothetical protein [unclassified Chryseobacterium]